MTHTSSGNTANDRGRCVLITGGSKGLGFAAATRFAQRGFCVVLTSRSAATAEVAAKNIRRHVPGAIVSGMALDLASLADVRAFAARFLSEVPALHILIANAAQIPTTQTPQHTTQGIEKTLGANHLGHFLLVQLLLPCLSMGVQDGGEARIVVVSSRLHQPNSLGPKVHFDFNDLQMQQAYHPMRAYKNSKLANLWFTYELDRQLADSKITVNALCPGFVPATAVAKSHGVERFLYSRVLTWLPFAHTLESAVDTYEFVATTPALKGISGRFYAEQQAIASSYESYSRAKAALLWIVSEQLTSSHITIGHM